MDGREQKNLFVLYTHLSVNKLFLFEWNQFAVSIVFTSLGPTKVNYIKINWLASLKPCRGNYFGKGVNTTIFPTSLPFYHSGAVKRQICACHETFLIDFLTWSTSILSEKEKPDKYLVQVSLIYLNDIFPLTELSQQKPKNLTFKNVTYILYFVAYTYTGHY